MKRVLSATYRTDRKTIVTMCMYNLRLGKPAFNEEIVGVLCEHFMDYVLFHQHPNEKVGRRRVYFFALIVVSHSLLAIGIVDFWVLEEKFLVKERFRVG